VLAELPPLTLKGGKHYAFRAELAHYSEDARLILQWQSPAMSKRILTGVPPDAVKRDAKDVGHLECGLLAEYGVANRPATVHARLEGQLDHEFGAAPPWPDLGATFWAAGRAA